MICAQELAHKLAMHAVAASPQYLTRSSVPESVLEGAKVSPIDDYGLFSPMITSDACACGCSGEGGAAGAGRQDRKATKHSREDDCWPAE